MLCLVDFLVRLSICLYIEPDWAGTNFIIGQNVSHFASFEFEDQEFNSYVECSPTKAWHRNTNSAHT